ncbi:glycosyltransferase [Paracoccus sp. (in: a-proteobacteria)]|uniref:glycosyltransferase n=1 Tax=Paracoccus sp. TaxID=267 RepID=UPI0026DF6835|nr:glycosyltransferase [Paracoccus sp. (in: a-proteobacteria)]MDO5648819.1 glycosyltransferase [Paracoccus sp. (in: a-proteobacteria)]
MRVQVLGLCRFSLLTDGWFQSGATDVDANRAALYDPARLDERMRFFEHLCLPSLRTQTDPDFTLIVATGEDLPDPWLSRLRAIADAVPQIRLMQSPIGPHGQICKSMLTAATDPDADVIAQFKMDDDDAVSVDYVETVRRDYGAISGLMEGQNPVALDYGHGLLLHVDGSKMTVDGALTHYWGCGLTMYFPAGEPRSVINYRHDWMWRQVTTVTKVDRVMWIRGFHGHNDSPHHHGKRIAAEMTNQQINQTLQRRFGLNRQALRRQLTGAD